MSGQRNRIGLVVLIFIHWTGIHTHEDLICQTPKRRPRRNEHREQRRSDTKVDPLPPGHATLGRTGQTRPGTEEGAHGRGADRACIGRRRGRLGADEEAGG
jgi:hypothetical protein